MPKVTFEREEIVVEAKPGQTLLEVAGEAGIDVFRGMWPALHCNRVKGWCNRCKVWVKPESPSAVNPPTGAERSALRINGRVSGTQRLACQVKLAGDVIVHTRSGGPEVKTNMVWEASTEPSKWKERWEKRHDKKEKDEPEEDSTEAKEA